MEINVTYRVTPLLSGMSRLVYVVESVTDTVITSDISKFLFQYRKPDSMAAAGSVKDAGKLPAVRTIETFNAINAPLFGTTAPVLWDSLPAVSGVLDAEDEVSDALFPTDIQLGTYVFDRLVRSNIVVAEGDIPSIDRIINWLNESMTNLKNNYNTYRTITTMLGAYPDGWSAENIGG